MNLKDSVREIETYLELDRKPVGVKIFTNKEDFDAYELPQYNRKITYCNSVQLASKEGIRYKTTLINQACPNGSAGMGFVEAPPKMMSGEARVGLGIYDNIEVSKSVSDGHKFFKAETYGILVQLLEDFTDEYQPDVVIQITSSFNAMRLIQGYAHHYGTIDSLKSVGLMAICNDLTSYVYNTDSINLSLLCPGTRRVANWHVDDVGVGVPYNKWIKTVDGVVKTTNPFARNDKKREIIKKLKDQGRNEEADGIELDKNYDTGSYTGGQVEITN